MGFKETISKKTVNKFPPHLFIEARAGTGKTTTLVEGLKYIKSIPTKIMPSDQQKAIWDSLILSKDARTIGFVAFNKSIADELAVRVPVGCSAMTLHSLGNRALSNQFGRLKVESYRVSNLICKIIGIDGRALKKNKPIVMSNTEELVRLCKLSLINHDLTDDESWAISLNDLCEYYDVEFDNETQKNETYSLVPRVLEACKDVQADLQIDFNDMIWLPVVLNIPLVKYDLLLVDEAQDLNKCQQELVKRCGSRLVFCGDPRQAIYGFAGADSRSMARLQEQLTSLGQQTQTLKLTETRRCGRSIVVEANRIVDDFTAHENNPAGKVTSLQLSTVSYDENGEQSKKKSFVDELQSGDMVVCRVNAQLVNQFFRTIAKGKTARIIGRDIGQNLISIIKKCTKEKVMPIEDLLIELDIWMNKARSKELAKTNPSENRLDTIADKYDCLVMFCQDKDTSQEVIGFINEVFSDDKLSTAIRFSTIHKAKGLEAKRVFFLSVDTQGNFSFAGKSKGWGREQEHNLEYVAITRAIEELFYVG